MRLLFVLSALLFSLQARAYFQMDLLKGKKSSASKESTQWTLADWLSQKSKIALADQWLALHRSSNWFEVNASAAHNRFWLKTADVNGVASTTAEAQSYTMDVYVSIFNLYGEYQKTSLHQEEFGGAAGLRLLGASTQTTSLVARYGWHRRQDLQSGEKWDNPFADGQLQLYIFKPFGLTGQYRYYFPADSNQGHRLEGHRVTAGAFLENAFFRLYGNYFQEPLHLGAGGVVTEETREGYEAGVKLFF